MSVHQDFEARWWGGCVNTYGEETKQLVYARHMGLRFRDRGGPGPECDMIGRSVVDIGGGPCSLLLKTFGLKRGLVIDPCPYPDWVADRYEAARIEYHRSGGETPFVRGPGSNRFNEAWIYNVLQHVEDPERVISNARHGARLIRIFEWVNVPAHLGHPHELTREKLDEWLGGKGTTATINSGGAVGVAYYGTFPA